jgi:hypothetical protein
VQRIQLGWWDLEREGLLVHGIGHVDRRFLPFGATSCGEP